MNRTIGKWIAALFTVGMALVLGSPLAAAPKRDKASLLKEREAWFSRTRRGPAGQSPAALRLKALAAAKQLPLAPRALAASLAAPALGGVWQELGPRPLQPGPYSGRATSLAVDLAHDPSGNTVYLGSAFGGVWKSTNGLSANPTFAPISDASLSLAVGAIALDTSTNPATLYVGTGESNLSTDSYYGIGILKSADGGLTWTLASTANGGSIPFLGLSFSRIVVDPGNPQVLLAATVQGNGINGA
ncbi:MAG TPA: hypothetical protein VK842_10365, partial [bacterium]|nr:hypothetical protein [bacterium]